MKLNVRHLVAFLLLVALSVGFGFGFDAVATAVERHRYPRPDEFADKISRYAAQYGLPEWAVLATVSCGSDFASNALSEDGRIGLMQLTPERFNSIRTELLGQEPAEAGLLYDPDTNLNSGCAYLSHLFERYKVWNLVFAAYRTDEETVDAWLTDPALTDQTGFLTDIPDPAVAAEVEALIQTMETYTKLYFSNTK